MWSEGATSFRTVGRADRDVLSTLSLWRYFKGTHEIAVQQRMAVHQTLSTSTVNIIPTEATLLKRIRKTEQKTDDVG